jgi:predicted nuclease of predicted toxin-antitoxin system
MRFLIDQDVYQNTTSKLIDLGHDAITAKQLGMQRASDRDLLRKAKETDRVFVTRDKDFGALVFLEEQLSKGVILLRIIPTTVEQVHDQLKRLLKKYSESELQGLFCVVEKNRYRIRRILDKTR